MLDAYISKRDVMKLLADWTDTKGLINRTDFQIALTKLQQYKKPQNKIGFKVNNAHCILQNIAKYPNSKRCKDVHSERQQRLRITDNERLGFIDTATGQRIEDWAMVETGKDLAAILGITEQTVIKWKSEGIIKRHDARLLYVHGTAQGTYWLELGYYYDLDEIRKNIICLG